jgi:hypothetical protein
MGVFSTAFARMVMPVVFAAALLGLGWRASASRGGDENGQGDMELKETHQHQQIQNIETLGTIADLADEVTENDEIQEEANEYEKLLLEYSAMLQVLTGGTKSTMLQRLGAVLKEYFTKRQREENGNLDWFGEKQTENDLRKFMADFLKDHPGNASDWDQDKLASRMGFLKQANRDAGMSAAVYQGGLFSIMLLAWHPGGCSYLHAHGQEEGHCAVQYVDGNVVESRYKFKNPNEQRMATLAEFQDLAGKIKADPTNARGTFSLTHADLEQSYAATQTGSYYIDDRYGMHRLCNKKKPEHALKQAIQALENDGDESLLEDAVRDSTVFGYSVHLYWQPYLSWFDYGKIANTMDPDFNAGMRLTFRRWLNMAAVPLTGKNESHQAQYKLEAQNRHKNHIYANECLATLGVDHPRAKQYRTLSQNLDCTRMWDQAGFLACPSVEENYPCPDPKVHKQMHKLIAQIETAPELRNSLSVIDVGVGPPAESAHGLRRVKSTPPGM